MVPQKRRDRIAGKGQEAIANQLIFPEKTNMAESIVPTIKIHKNPGALFECYIDEADNKAWLTSSQIARILGVDRIQVVRLLVGTEYKTKTAEIETGSGVKVGTLYPPKALYKCAAKWKPELAEAMAEAGANLFVLGLAGYEVRPTKRRLTHAEIVELCCLPTPSDWSRRFPEEYYEQLSRLTGLSAIDHKRPARWAQLTKQLVYDYLPPGVYEKIKWCKAETGSFDKLHQFLAEDGLLLLQTHQERLLTLMQASSSLDELSCLLAKVCTGQYQLGLFERKPLQPSTSPKRLAAV